MMEVQQILYNAGGINGDQGLLAGGANFQTNTKIKTPMFEEEDKMSDEDELKIIA